jgi:hypothetical protein
VVWLIRWIVTAGIRTRPELVDLQEIHYSLMILFRR